MKSITCAVIGILFFACQQKPASSSDAAPPVNNPEIVDRCFQLVDGRDTTFVQLTIRHDSEVSGEMQWRPWEKDGAYGMLNGKKEGDVIKAEWMYTIEGSEQSEELEFKLTGNTLARKVGELEEKDPNNPGHLRMKDPASAPYAETFAATACQ